MKKWILITTAAILITCLLVSVSCAKGAVTAPNPSLGPGQSPETFTSKDGYSDGNLPSNEEERMIVRTGELLLIVEDIVQSRDNIAQLAVNLNGYVVSSRISGEDQDMRGWISIRVPDEQFEQALTELRALAVRISSENTSSQDITEQYTDLQSRLKNAEATESQYLELLKRAEVEETIRIYELLHQVRGEIEQIKGQMQYLERTSSMSLISVVLSPVATAKPLVRTGWSVLEALKSAIRGIVIFGQWLVVAAIFVLIFSPVWGTVLGIFLWRRHKRKTSQ